MTSFDRVLVRNIVPAVVALCAATQLYAEWDLWPSPNDNVESVDQQQTSRNFSYWSANTGCPAPTTTRFVGQQFVPTVSSLYRIDIRTEDQWDPRPASFKLWQWNTDHATTVAQQPLFTEPISLAGVVYQHLVPVYPRLTVTPGKMYYFELSVEGRDATPLAARSDQTGADPYREGKAFRDCTFYDTAQNHEDLWFRTYGSPDSQGPLPSPPTLTPSTAATWYPPDPPCSVITPGCPGYGEACPASGDGRFATNVYSKCDYFKRFNDYMNYVGCAFKSCGGGYGQEPMIEAVLYEDSCRRGTCNESYAANAITMLREMYDYEFDKTTNPPCCPPSQPGCPPCQPDTSFGTHWFEHVGVTYAFVQNSPTLQDVDRRRIRCVMIDSAKKFWPNREVGPGNRPMAAATTYLLATNAWDPFSNDDQCPALTFTQAEHDTWIQYAENNWNTFWNARNWASDSAGYIDAVASRLTLQYAYFSGRDALVWADAGFHDLIDDIYKEMSPLGINANYGEGGGIADLQTALIWLFEKAAKKYGDPKYKWLAHQIYRYNETRLCDSPGPPPAGTQNDSFRNGISDVAMAYLETDDQLSDAAPSPQSELLGANTSALAFGWNNFALGQTFKPTVSPLARLDVRLKGNQNNTSSGTIKLWLWNTNYATTVAQTPLYQDTVNMATANVNLSFFPFLEVNTNATYFFEISRPQHKFTLGGGPQAEDDPYPDGVLYNQSAAVLSADLWFRTWSLTPNGSIYTTRLSVSRRPISEWYAPCPTPLDMCWQMHDYGVATIPDKLILRSGYQPSDLHALFTLTISAYDHGDWNPAGLSLLTDDNAVIMAETAFPYPHVMPRSTIDNSLPEVRRYWGGTLDTPPSNVTIGHFSDTRKATVAWIDWSDVHGWGVQQQRRLFFVKDRFLWVRDRFTFPTNMTAAIGTVWHAGDIHSTYGSNWYDIYYRQPLGNLFEQRNPERYASLYFIKRDTEDVAAFREATYDPPPACSSVLADACETLPNVPGQGSPLDCRSGPPFVIWHRWKGSAAANDTRYMDAIVLPHGAPAGVAPPIQTPLYDDGRNTAIRVTVEGETWTLVDNPDGISINQGGVTTNARYLIARTKTGLPNYVLTYDASQVVVTGTPSINLSWPVRTSVELGGY